MADYIRLFYVFHFAVAVGFTCCRLFILDYSTVLLPHTYKALLAEMCRIGDSKGLGHFEAKF